MNALTYPIEALPCLREAKTFACFCRVWWDGASMDAVAWYEHDGNYSRWVVNGGEKFERQDLVLESTQVDTKEHVESIMAQFKSIGFCEIQSQEEKIIYTHYDDWYGLLAPGMSKPYWIKVRGGKHSDVRVGSLLDAVYAECPQLETKN